MLTRATPQGIWNDVAKKNLLSANRPSGEFVTREQLGEFAVFLASDARRIKCATPRDMAGGWAAH
jgi:hypothetical protein